MNNSEINLERMYQFVHDLDPGECVSFGGNRLSSIELQFVFERCMQEVVEHTAAAGFRPPVTAREMPNFLPGYYAHLQRRQQFTWSQVPGLLDELAATWYAEAGTGDARYRARVAANKSSSSAAIDSNAS